jgi:hypothetical protein
VNETIGFLFRISLKGLGALVEDYEKLRATFGFQNFAQTFLASLLHKSLLTTRVLQNPIFHSYSSHPTLPCFITELAAARHPTNLSGASFFFFWGCLSDCI